MRRRQSDGAKLIVIDPRRTATAEAADLHLAVRPGADLPLLAAMLGVIIDEQLLDRTFIDRHTEGYEQALATARRWPVTRAAEATGVPADDIVAAARMFGRAPRAMTLWSMGINQSTVGTLKNRALINLCLATGNIGRAGSGPLSLTGQPNAMGGRESGGLSTLLPGYRSVSDPDHRAEMRQLWEIPADLPGISPAPGVPATELTDALEAGAIKVVWVVATNPAVSQPDAQRFAAALRRAELVVCQDAYHPTETSAARARRAARRAVAREGRDDDELRAARGAAAPRARAAGSGARGLADLRPACARARTWRELRVALGGRGIRRVRRDDGGQSVRRQRSLAPAARSGRPDAMAGAIERDRQRRPLRDRAAVHGDAVPDGERQGSIRVDAAQRAGGRPEPGLSARADDRADRHAVAHDDAHRQVA
jgi:hypothetical protein